MQIMALVAAVIFIGVFLHTGKLDLLVWGVVLLLFGSIGAEQ